jgi:hypothetical protein
MTKTDCHGTVATEMKLKIHMMSVFINETVHLTIMLPVTNMQRMTHETKLKILLGMQCKEQKYFQGCYNLTPSKSFLRKKAIQKLLATAIISWLRNSKEMQ